MILALAVSSATAQDYVVAKKQYAGYGYPTEVIAENYRRPAGPVFFQSYFLKGKDLLNRELGQQLAIDPQAVAAQYPAVASQVGYQQIAALGKYAAEPAIYAQPEKFAAFEKVYQENIVPQAFGQQVVAQQFADIAPQVVAQRYASAALGKYAIAPQVRTVQVEAQPQVAVGYQRVIRGPNVEKYSAEDLVAD